MRRRMTFAEFLDRLPKTGWYLTSEDAHYLDKGIRRQSPESCDCPWLWMRIQPGITARRADRRWLFRAADNTPGHDPAIRAALLKACGLEGK